MNDGPINKQGISEMIVNIQDLVFKFIPEQTPLHNINNVRSQLVLMFMQLSAIPNRECQDVYYESKRSAIRMRLSVTLDNIVIDNFPHTPANYHSTCEEMRRAVLKEACVVLGSPACACLCDQNK